MATEKKLYEYAIILQPKLDKDGDVVEEARLVVEPTYVLATSQEQADMWPLAPSLTTSLTSSTASRWLSALSEGAAAGPVWPALWAAARRGGCCSG